MLCNSRIPTDVSDIGRFFERIETKDINPVVIMEAIGFYFRICDSIVSRGHYVKVVYPVR